MKHIKRLFEEIGFDYKKAANIPDEDVFAEEVTDIATTPFALSTIEKSYKKLAKSAFEAGAKNTMTFEDWWSKTWDFGGPKEEKPVAVKKERGTLGFDLSKLKRSQPVAAEPKIEDSFSDDITDSPRRPRPGRPTAPPPVKKPTRRRGIWFDGEE